MARRLWRPAVGVAAAYAIAMQSLLIAMSAVSLPVQAADRAASAYVICEHAAQTALQTDSQEQPSLPTPTPVNFQHCIFCFAGTHVAVLASPLLPPSQLVGISARAAHWIADSTWLPAPSAYVLARPRGPPAQA